MTQTKYMQADDIAHGFNSTDTRGYWVARVGGTRTNPEVHFNSRSSMVQLSYRIATSDFLLTFTHTQVAFGDYLASAHRSMVQILSALKAAGLPFAAPVEDRPTLRATYDPVTKGCVVALAPLGDDWPNAEPMVFKVPERALENNSDIPLDAQSGGN